MAPALNKVIYKPDSQSTEEFTVIVNPDEYNKWKAGDTTIPLVEVVDSFQVFCSNQGAQGQLMQPSKQQLETVFGSSKEDDVVEKILKEGKEQPGDGIRSNKQFGATNVTRGGFVDHGGR